MKTQEEVNIQEIIERGYIGKNETDILYDEKNPLYAKRIKKVNIVEEGSLNGEGVWCFILTEVDYDKYFDDNNTTETIHVILDNDSFHFNVPTHGLVLECKLNGDSRPTITVKEMQRLLKVVKW
jgi:hypothetical protein